MDVSALLRLIRAEDPAPRTRESTDDRESNDVAPMKDRIDDWSRRFRV